MSIVSKRRSLLSIRIVNSKRAVAFERVNLAAGEETELGPTSPLLAGAKNGAPGVSWQLVMGTTRSGSLQVEVDFGDSAAQPEAAVLPCAASESEQSAG